MGKIGIIIKREYTSRVMKKSFLLLTFLTPVFMALLMVLPIWISTLEDDAIKNIVVVDKFNDLSQVLESNDQYTFIFSDKPIEEVRKEKVENKTDKKSELEAVLYISDTLMNNPNAATIYSENQVNINLKEYINSKLNSYVRDEKLASYNIPNLKEMVESSKTKVNITTIKWDETGKDKEGSAELSLIIGMISAFLIYIFIMAYGGQVMSGVTQEKTSRIVEVIISSVKPFELMMGKIIGVALVGLTQFGIWIIFTLILGGIGTSLLGMNAMPEMSQMTDLSAIDGNTEEIMGQVLGMLSGFNFTKIILLFVFYFMGGYLLYASFFAAIGSAVDNETDTQQFVMPITLPIILAIIIGMNAAQNPTSSLAFWGSIIPFTSPVVMMARIPYDVPLWEIILSLSVLVVSFILSTWLAGKIYRTGILMYGKKVSWKELWKWIRVK
jgi:ABC-2 type transport system permease protein